RHRRCAGVPGPAPRRPGGRARDAGAAPAAVPADAAQPALPRAARGTARDDRARAGPARPGEPRRRRRRAAAPPARRPRPAGRSGAVATRGARRGTDVHARWLHDDGRRDDLGAASARQPPRAAGAGRRVGVRPRRRRRGPGARQRPGGDAPVSAVLRARPADDGRHGARWVRGGRRRARARRAVGDAPRPALLARARALRPVALRRRARPPAVRVHAVRRRRACVHRPPRGDARGDDDDPGAAGALPSGVAGRDAAPLPADVDAAAGPGARPPPSAGTSRNGPMTAMREQPLGAPELLPLHCPVPPAIHPQADAIERRCIGWIDRFELYGSAAQRERLIGTRAAEIYARALPDADAERVADVAKWLYWGFATDDLYYDNGPTSRRAADFLALGAPLVRLSEEPRAAFALELPYNDALRDLTRAILRHATPGQRLEWAHTARAWFFGMAWDVANAERGVPTTLNIANAIELTPVQAAAGPVRALVEAWSTFCLLLNDLMSFAKEERNADSSSNVLRVIAHERSCTPREAIPEAHALTDRIAT